MNPPPLRHLVPWTVLGLTVLFTHSARAECERECKAGQTRDVNGCCVGAVAPPTPKPAKEPPTARPTGATPAPLGATQLDGGPAGLDWVVIPRGTFSMGSTEGDDDQKPVRQVTVDRFGMAKTETTVAQYGRCVTAGSCSVPEECQWGPGFRTYGEDGKASHPVNCVTWFQARDFCQWAGGRLPTEAEWEYAAKGTDGRRFPWGNMGPDKDPQRVGNFADASAEALKPDWTFIAGYDDGYAGTSPVGSFAAGRSPFGLDDMAGNVWEWVIDWHGEYDISATDNPTGPNTGEFRVYRGGSFFYGDVRDLRAAARYCDAPSYAAAYLGFRCARSP